MKHRQDNNNFRMPVAVLLAAALMGMADYAGAQELRRVSDSGAVGTAKTSDWQEGTTSKISVDEYRALNRTDGTNDRIKTYIRLARARLKSALDLIDHDDYTGANEQIQVYAALITDAGRYRAASVGPYDKANKTLEQGLFEQLRLLDGIRRNMTSIYSEGAEQAYILATRVRLQSLAALLGTGMTLLPRSENP
jgi:hypothetical protein